MKQNGGKQQNGNGGGAASSTVSDAIVHRLKEWGIQRIFGFPGDGINGVLGALRRAEHEIEFVQLAHEELAGMAACAHAKFTGALGVCLSTGGPGLIHMLNGMYDAKLDHTPLLAIVGQQAMAGIGGSEQQEVDLLPLLKDVASYVQVIGKPQQVRHVIDRAVRVALGHRTVTCVIVPHDVQREEYKEPAHEHGMQHSSVALSEPRVIPREEDLRSAAAVLNAGKRVAILVGAGALHATDEIIAIAERLQAGVAKALLGKATVPDDLPFVTGSVGWLGTRASNEMMKECDTLLLVGTSFPYTEFLPEEGHARGVQVDIAPENVALRYPMEVALIGDSAETLRALLPLLRDDDDRSAWRTHIEQKVSEWWEEAERHARAEAPPLNPQLPFWELSSRLPDDAILTGDSGSSTVWLARDVRIRRGMQFSLSGNLATMGAAVPYAVAAKFAFPHRPVIATSGDGAMQMIGNAALIDVAKHWRKWSDPRLIVLVLNNRDLNYVTWEQRVMEGEPRFAASQDLPDFSYARYAELLGLRGIRIDAPEDVAAAWDEALRADRPVVIEAVVNADIPTVPPTLKAEQAKKLEKSLADDPEAPRIREQMRRQEIHSGKEAKAEQGGDADTQKKSRTARSRDRRSHSH